MMDYYFKCADCGTINKAHFHTAKGSVTIMEIPEECTGCNTIVDLDYIESEIENYYESTLPITIKK